MKKYNLLLVSHPDDETIFAGGLLQMYRRRPWKVVCVTDGNADGEGASRNKDFLAACREFKVAMPEMWDFPDKFESRLDLDRLVKRLEKETPSEVFTHGILGEYGHPHHQDVCLAAHRAFKPKLPVWSVAYNCFADKTIRLPRKAYERKCKVLSQTYFSQTQNFARWLPVSNQEGFVQLTNEEVEALHAFFSQGKPVPKDALKCYAWFAPYLENFRQAIHERPF